MSRSYPSQCHTILRSNNCFFTNIFDKLEGYSSLQLHFSWVIQTRYERMLHSRLWCGHTFGIVFWNLKLTWFLLHKDIYILYAVSRYILYIQQPCSTINRVRLLYAGPSLSADFCSGNKIYSALIAKAALRIDLIAVSRHGRLNQSRKRYQGVICIWNKYYVDLCLCRCHTMSLNNINIKYQTCPWIEWHHGHGSPIYLSLTQSQLKTF